MVFLDSSGLAAYANARDQFYGQARAVYTSLRETRLTTDAVLTETAAFFSPVGSRSLAVHLKDTIDRASQRGFVEVIHADAALIQRAWELYRDRPDKDYSLVDCMSFLVMRERGILRAFTHDDHFEQEGFVRLIQ
ncbi:MAG: hypothetical protein COZ06_36860 [Armatimonadetes bacterium CG_4_10_14_3_um_filter_66_18]|nr:PIN domain-containing protein [Armatimonadota bacterium]OIO98708.1 MAG: hypothetical protein AUJ96_20710 [Armatimonadetes bacterium CG2_30_66_41]PIU89892.1 MAG: hypothetical protein COS65_26880 [Armatimonadetes bacterium CG06_land_8_20_14_3_00_66_21]PIX41749.1 MAG: hypothetical protein COZ57_22730 [Armatimonadetes bacterium CG_4_8_14_3_um_filter_66_20]PIY36143.1 MAG: hypothetical protein COZ06_36860 [Armatimonadetes bacterium CG_4_10_14_3_um_filter_66_18]PIZ38555.1 MAG: hypothetical protein